MSYRTVFSLLMVLALGTVSAAAQDTRSQDRVMPADSIRPEDTLSRQVLERPTPRYRLQPGDVVELSFPFTPEFNQTMTLQPDGYVNLQAVGDLKVGDLTVPEVTAALEKKYADVLNTPVITVKLTEFERPFFIAAGEIGRPGKYEIKRGVTLSEAVAVAGGLSKDARDTQILVFRRTSGDMVEVKEFDLEKLYKGESVEDLDLHAGDMVYVPERRLSKIKPYLPVAALRLWFDPFSF